MTVENIGDNYLGHPVRPGSNTVEVCRIPVCDVCKNASKMHFAPAHVDGKMQNGSWAYMCKECFKVHGVGVGLGYGQIMRLKE